MLLRPMTLRDISVVASLIGDALHDDDLFDYLTPYKHEYPISWHTSHVNHLRNAYLDPDVFCIVGVADDHEREKYAEHFARRGTDIMGVTIWKFEGVRPFPKAPVEHTDKASVLGAPFERWATRMQMQYIDMLGLDKARSFRQEQHFRRFVAARKPYKPLDSVACRLHLRILAVHPDLHRNGYGTQLLRYGVDFARPLDLLVTLRSSKTGRQTYKKSGFKIIGWDIDGLEDGFQGEPLPSAPTMVLDPNEKYTRPVDATKGEDRVTNGDRTFIRDVCWNIESS